MPSPFLYATISCVLAFIVIMNSSCNVELTQETQTQIDRLINDNLSTRDKTGNHPPDLDEDLYYKQLFDRIGRFEILEEGRAFENSSGAIYRILIDRKTSSCFVMISNKSKYVVTRTSTMALIACPESALKLGG